MKKRITGILLSLALLTSLSACGGKERASGTDSTTTSGITTTQGVETEPTSTEAPTSSTKKTTPSPQITIPRKSTTSKASTSTTKFNPTVPVTTPPTWPAAKFMVFAEAYDSASVSYYPHLAMVQKGGKWGVINRAGETVVDFVYDEPSMINKDGFFILYRKASNNVFEYTSYLFNKNGQNISTSSNKELFVSCSENVVLCLGITGNSLEDSPVKATYRTVSGQVIKTVDNVLQATSFQDGLAAVCVEDASKAGGYNGYIFDSGSNVIYQDSTHPYFLSAGGKGYFLGASMLTDTLGLVDSSMRRKEKELSDWGINSGGFYPFPTPSGVTDCINAGTLVAASAGDLFYLTDLAKIRNGGELRDGRLNSRGYTNLVLNLTEAYFLVSLDDNCWGYLSRDGKTERLYADATAFINGKAMVKDPDGSMYVIDSSFNRLTDKFVGYDRVATAGSGMFALQRGNQFYIAVYNG